jgi:hypothetical protein
MRRAVATGGTRETVIAGTGPLASGDGRVIGFQTFEPLVPADTNGMADLYFRLASVGAIRPAYGEDGPDWVPAGTGALDSTGYFAAFEASYDDSLAFNERAIHVRELRTDRRALVSTLDGTPIRGSQPAIGGGGLVVAFMTGDERLTGDTTRRRNHVMVTTVDFTLPRPQADLGVTISGSPGPLGDVVFTVTVTNHGPDPILHAGLDFTKEPGGEVLGGPTGPCTDAGSDASRTRIRCELIEPGMLDHVLLPGESYSQQLFVEASVAGDHVGTVTVRSDDSDDPDPSNNSATATVGITSTGAGAPRGCAVATGESLPSWLLVLLGAALLRRGRGRRPRRA